MKQREATGRCGPQLLWALTYTTVTAGKQREATGSNWPELHWGCAFTTGTAEEATGSNRNQRARTILLDIHNGHCSEATGSNGNQRTITTLALYIHNGHCWEATGSNRKQREATGQNYFGAGHIQRAPLASNDKQRARTTFGLDIHKEHCWETKGSKKGNMGSDLPTTLGLEPNAVTSAKRSPLPSTSYPSTFRLRSQIGFQTFR